MDRQAAQQKAREEAVSIGDLRELIAGASIKGGMSKVNPGLTLRMVCGIYEEALAGRDAAEVPKAWKRDIHSRNIDAQKPSRDFLIVTNILRDCA
jgi:hypothetical protein